MNYTDRDKLHAIALIVDSELMSIKEDLNLLEEMGKKDTYAYKTSLAQWGGVRKIKRSIDRILAL